MSYGSKLTKNKVYFAHIFGGALGLITFTCPNVFDFKSIVILLLSFTPSTVHLLWLLHYKFVNTLDIKFSFFERKLNLYIVGVSCLSDIFTHVHVISYYLSILSKN